MAVLGSTSLTGCNSIPDFIGAGSLMLFQQSTAPINWTKQITHNDKALRVVSGPASSGGTFTFTTVFGSSFASKSIPGTVGDTTLSTPQIPSHTHPYNHPVQPGFANVGKHPSKYNDVYDAPTSGNSNDTGGGGSHTHSFAGGSISFEVQYVDVIICSKN